MLPTITSEFFTTSPTAINSSFSSRNLLALLEHIIAKSAASELRAHLLLELQQSLSVIVSIPIFSKSTSIDFDI
ncbi:MAG: hypothetical protein RR840_02540 [Clostridium sp.]